MSIIYILIPIAIILTAIGIYLFFWAVKTEQFDDLEKQGLSILFDENDPKKTDDINTKSESNSNNNPNQNKNDL
jgi:cbb3-type cytochrome oxidase maturation protein